MLTTLIVLIILVACFFFCGDAVRRSGWSWSNPLSVILAILALVFAVIIIKVLLGLVGIAL